MPNKLISLPPEIGSRVKAARENLGYNQKDFAELLQIGQSTLSRIENGERPPSPELLYRLAVEFPTLDIREILVGYPTCQSIQEVPKLIINAQNSGLAGSNDVAGDDYLAVPLVDGKTAADSGAISFDKAKSFILVSKAEVGNRKQLVGIKVTQKNMQPTVPAGAIAVIDRNEWQPQGKRKHIWAIRDQSGDTTINRLFKFNDGILVLNDNSDEYPPDIAWTDDLPKLVVGKVVWICRGLD